MNQSVIRYTKEPYIEVVRDSKIESFGFSVFSDAEILKAAEVEVWKSNYYSRVDLTPVPNGLLDPRMGSTTKDKTCATCHGTFTECPGHSGYLKLVLPVYNAGFFNVVVNILKCLCMSCGRVLLDEKVRRDFLKKMRNPKLEATKKAELMKNIVKECSKEAKRTCCRCKYSNGSIRREAGGFAIVQDRKKCKDKFDDECNSALSYRVANAPFKPADILNPVTVLSLFKKMKDEDCELLNLSNRPENLITSIINVPPIALRPSVVMAGKAGSNENDISESLKLIIQANSSLGRDLLDSSYASKAMVSWDILQGESALYIDSDAHVQLNQQSNKKLSGFTQRLNGKQGRFRGNLSAKRVEHTARTVISPDPNLKITEVGIPIFMALKLTYPERVHKHNIEKLRRLVRNGTSKYPGAKFIEFPNGEKMILNARTHRAADALKYGDIVHRHLEDGDIVLFNRQPSLHRMSIMSHRARIMSGKTLRFNECVCNPYNADFDGDEMNLHVPQGEEARTEALELLGVKNNLCTPKNGEILVAATQDFLTTSFLITRKDTFYDRAKFSLLCTYMGDAEDHIDLPTPAISKPIELWTGKQVFSVLTRPNARIRVYVNLSTKEKSYKKPRDKDETMCVNDGYVYIRNGELICGQLGKATLGNGNKSGLFSVLLRDYNADAAATCMNRLAKLSARWIGDHGFSIGIDDVQPGENLSSQKRGKISESYRDCDNLIQSYNKGQLTLEPGCDAAQSLEAKITKELNDIRESAAKVCMNELHWRNSPLIMSQCGSKGSPINISQMIACVGQQSVGGRRAPDGFIERSLPHFPRNSKTPAAKGFVANSFYSGLSATEFFFHTMGGREGLVDTAVKTAETGYMSRRLMKCLEDLSTQYDNTVRNSSGHIVQFLYGDDGMDPALMEGDKGTPLNFDRLMSKVQATCPSMSHVFLSPRKIREDLSKFKETHMRTGYSDEFIGQISRFLENRVKQLENTVNALGLDECCDGERKDLLESVAQNISGVTEKQLQVFLNICQSRYNVKRIEPGTAIGAIGAQSIGEPGTQMTLKTFHFAGVASMNITQGVPRIREIINATKNISTPIITALLEPNNKESHARKVKANVEKTTLGQIAKSIKLVLNSRSAALIVKLDTKRIAASKLCITADMVKDSILENKKYKLTAEDVKVDGETLRIIPNDDKTKIPAHFVLQYLKKLLPSVVVQGIKSVERVVIKKQDPNDKCDKLEDNEPYKLFVEGKGLQKVMGVEGVNGLSTYSNDINEMQHTLGIEAARGTIIDEIEYTMVGHGMSIDTRHMMLLADLMTYKGEVLGITRFGLQKMKESVLMLASFEKTSEHLFNAAVSGRVDAIEGVSECVIMGVPVKVGTGILSVGQSIQQVPQLCYGRDTIIS